MKAFIQNGFGGIETLTLTEVPTPNITNDEVLVQVKAISINPVDVKTRVGKGIAGRLKEASPLVIGWDISGIISAVGSNVTDFKVGDEVFGMVNFPGHGKGYAEFVAVPASHLAVKPSNISHEEAAAATLAALTAWQAMTKHGQIKANDKVFVHAASGGVGNYAVQIAKHLGAYVIGSSSAKNREFVSSLGADEHFDYQLQQLNELENSIDFVLDTVAGENAERSIDILKQGGTYISILGISPVILEKAQQKGVQAAAMLVESSGTDMKQLAELLAKGIIKSHISKSFPFEQMGEAHLQVETGRTVGKIAVML